MRRSAGEESGVFADGYSVVAHEALTTAYINDVDDFGVFNQQLFGYGCPRDVFLGIATFGNRKNVMNATVVARTGSMKMIGLTGKNGGELASVSDVAIQVPKTKAYMIQEIDNQANFFSLMSSVNALEEKYDMPVLYSCHPRAKKCIEQRNFVFDRRANQHKPLSFFDNNKLQQNAYCVVSDSGTVPEECAYFKFPAVSISTSTERPEAMNKGIFVGSITSKQVLQADDIAVSMHENGDDGLDRS